MKRAVKRVEKVWRRKEYFPLSSFICQHDSYSFGHFCCFPQLPVLLFQDGDLTKPNEYVNENTLGSLEVVLGGGGGGFAEILEVA